MVRLPEDAIDIGHGHYISFTQWEVDRSIAFNAENFEGIPDEPFYGLIDYHKRADGTYCSGFITFDTPTARALNEHAKIKGYREHPLWTVEQNDPLTLSPSLLCQCGEHGFIQNGKWVPA